MTTYNTPFVTTDLTITTSGEYQIDAAGAAGYSGPNNTPVSGDEVSADVSLTAGEQISIGPGGQGIPNGSFQASGAVSTVIETNTGSAPTYTPIVSAAGGNSVTSYASPQATNVVITPKVNPGDGYVTINQVPPANCYLAGTMILTLAGDRPVETLAIGDRLITRFGGVRPIKWIGKQSFGARFTANNPEKQPVCIRAGALGHMTPKRDLFVSPGHAMLIDDTLVVARFLVNGVTITQGIPFADVHYYQIEFEDHDCVCAEGAWSESYADAAGWRDHFHNAGEFHALYPNHVAPAEEKLCAPRPKRKELDMILKAVALRAARVSSGKLRGDVDKMLLSGVVQGWAWDLDHPELTVVVEALLDGRVVGSALAHEHRADLEAAVIGGGYRGFSIDLNAAIEPERLHDVQVRRACDGDLIGLSESCFETTLIAA